MNFRLISVVVFAELFIAAPIAFWLMWRFAFRGMIAYHLGNTLIALTFGLPVLVGAFIYLRNRRENA